MFSASDMQAYDDCAARFYHSKQRYDHVLETDRTAADVSSAIHDALMTLHRQVEQALRTGRVPTGAEAAARLDKLVEAQLRRKRLDPTDPAIAARLGGVADGLARTSQLIVDDVPLWAIDGSTGDPLVWVEAPLDHGSLIRAVQMGEGYLARTRPDVIGVQLTSSGIFRPLVRDYKARNEIVHPAFDTGILVRGIWVALELQQPRCQWFLANRAIELDRGAVDLETVNLPHADGDDFLIHTTISVERLLQERDRLTALMGEMADTLAADVLDVPASPGGLCARWCPYLDRCQPGMAHVRKYLGVDALHERLGEI
jgi:hypothetical protein